MRLVSLTQYKDRAEERRRAVGSTAITNPKPAVQPVVTVPTGEVVPGYSAATTHREGSSAGDSSGARRLDRCSLRRRVAEEGGGT